MSLDRRNINSDVDPGVNTNQIRSPCVPVVMPENPYVRKYPIQDKGPFTVFTRATDKNKISPIKIMSYINKSYKSVLSSKLNHNTHKPMFCSICQQFNHTSKFCKRMPKCAHCQGQHLTNNCNLPHIDRSLSLSILQFTSWCWHAKLSTLCRSEWELQAATSQPSSI